MENVVYHGSPNGDIEVLKSHISTHRKKCIYATDNKVIAMMFMGRDKGDLDTVKEISNGIPVLVERRPGVFDNAYNKSGYIYELPGETFNHYDYLWSPEVISFEEEIVPIKKEYCKNILKSLEEFADKGLLKLYRYPDRPDYIPLDNSDLIDKYIFFKEKGIDSAIESLLKVYPEFEEMVNDKLNKKIR